MAKYDQVKDSLANVHESTREVFQSTVKRTLKIGSVDAKSRFFSNYVDMLTNYILNSKISACREDFSKKLEEDDKINTEMLSLMNFFDNANKRIK